MPHSLQFIDHILRHPSLHLDDAIRSSKDSGCIGGILGILFGCLGSLIAGKFLLQGMILWPTQSITVGAFLFSVVLGILFGLYPAIKASGLQPVVALRAD